MEKLELQTKDLKKENIEKLIELFPEILTEIEKDGQIIKTVNVDKLKELIGDIADKEKEVYELSWAGKQKAKMKVYEPINKTLRPVIEDSVDFENTENLYIEGDNFEVLKLLKESYANKIKMIYIDPPYNTGKDFVYKDNFKGTRSDYEDEAGLVDDDGNRLSNYKKNEKTNPWYHSDWLNMMYERLSLAYKLLKKDGVIFISIDDNEVHNLRKVCDEIFGEGNFVGQITWLKKRKGSFLSKKMISLTEYCLVYSKSEDIFLFGGKPSSKESQPIVKRTNSIGILNFPRNLVKTKLNDGLYKKGHYGEGSSSVELLEDVVVKNGLFITEINLKGPFTWSQFNLNKEIENKTEIMINTTNFQVRILKIYSEKDFKGLSSIIKGVEINATTETGYEELKKIFNEEKILDYPKPINLIKYLINSGTYFEKDSIILDFFSGSATTAHAVMQLNVEDQGNRKYIMVQLPEKTDENSEAYKAGYKNICEIGKERIRRAAKKIQEEKPNANIDFGFRVFRLDDSNMKDVYYNPKKMNQNLLQDFKEVVKEDRTSEDLLFQVMLSMGVPISEKVEIKEIEGTKVFQVSNNYLIACFEKNISQETIKKIVEEKPLRIVFKESCFKDDSAMINASEYIKNVLFDGDEKNFKNNVKLI